MSGQDVHAFLLTFAESEPAAFDVHVAPILRAPTITPTPEQIASDETCVEFRSITKGGQMLTLYAGIGFLLATNIDGSTDARLQAFPFLGPGRAERRAYLASVVRKAYPAAQVIGPAGAEHRS